MSGEGILANRSPQFAQKEAPPYSYVANVDCSGGDVTFSGNHICELRCKTQGSIKVDTTESTGVTLYSAGYDIFSLRIKKVYKTGTDAGLQSNSITVFGFPD